MDLLRALLEGLLDERGYVQAFRERLVDGGYPIRSRIDAVGALRQAGYRGRLGLGKYEVSDDSWRILWDVCYGDTVQRRQHARR